MIIRQKTYNWPCIISVLIITFTFVCFRQSLMFRKHPGLHIYCQKFYSCVKNVNNFYKVCSRLQKIGTLNKCLGVGKDSQNRDA